MFKIKLKYRIIVSSHLILMATACPIHSQIKSKFLQKACLYPGCSDPCLCTACEKIHDADHNIFVEDLNEVFNESLLDEVSGLVNLAAENPISKSNSPEKRSFLAEFLSKDLKNAFENAYTQLLKKLMPSFSQLYDLESSLTSLSASRRDKIDKSSYSFEPTSCENLKLFLKDYSSISNQFDRIVYEIYHQLRTSITDLSKYVEYSLTEQVKVLSEVHQERIDRYTVYKATQKNSVPAPITSVKVRSYFYNSQDYLPIGELLVARCTLYQKDRKFLMVSNSNRKILKQFTVEEFHPETDQLLITQQTLQLLGFKKDATNEETFVYIYDLRSGKMCHFSSIPLRVNSVADSLNKEEVWLATDNRGLYLLDLPTFQISLFATVDSRVLTDIFLLPSVEQLIGLTSDYRIQVFSIAERVPVLLKTVPLATLDNYKNLKISDACVYGNKNAYLYVSVYGKLDQFQSTTQIGHLFWIGDTDFYYPRVQKLEELSAPFNFKLFRAGDKTTVIKWIKRINTTFPYPAIIFKDSTDTFIHHVRINEPKKILLLQRPYCLLILDNDHRVKFIC